MKYFPILVSVFLLIFSCKENVNLSKSEECIPYFDFDEVEYYHIDISDRAVFGLIDSEEPEDTLLFSILNEGTLSKLSDTIFITNLNDLGYTKSIVDANAFSEIHQIFCERKHNIISESACETIYRNILILKKENRIVGTAKICFECQKSSIAGTKRNTQDFGQSGDFQKLKNLLLKYRK